MGRRLEGCARFATRSRFLGLAVSLGAWFGAGCWPVDDPCLWNKDCHGSHGESCRIGSQRYQAGQSNPDNPCLVCQPQVSTTTWSSLPEGEACGTGRVCSASASCLGADGQSCTLAGDCASDVCGRYYLDQDGDGEGVNTATLLCGATTPQGYAARGGDCCDTDPNANSLQKAFFTVPNACGNWDYSCTHSVDPQPPIHSAGCEGTPGSSCEGKSVRAGWCYTHDHPTLGTVCINVLPWEVQMPSCGESGPFLVSGGSCVLVEDLMGCVVVTRDAVLETRTAACR